jgi:TolB protein
MALTVFLAAGIYAWSVLRPSRDVVGPAARSVSPGSFLFSGSRDNVPVMFSADSDGSRLRPIETGLESFGATWSTGARQIAFAGCMKGDCDYTQIYVVDADGSNLRQLTDGPKLNDYDPAWSPDATKIVFSRLLKDGFSRLFVVDVESLDVTQLTDDETYQDQDPDWSPDGKTIAFMRNADTYPSIYLIDADGTDLRRLTESKHGDSSPAWSPDGEQIAFVRDLNQESLFDVFVMAADGTGVRQIADGGGVLQPPEPVWSPDGDQIAFFLGTSLSVMAADGPGETIVLEVEGEGVYSLGPGGVDWA